MKTQIGTLIENDTHSELVALARADDLSLAQVIRRACRREVAEHRAANERLINGRTRTAQRKAKTRKARAAA